MANHGHQHVAFARIREFIKLESAAGVFLFAAAVLALIISNSPANDFYQAFFNFRISVHLGVLQLSKPLILWINDGFMTLFFLLVGLEIKREIFLGELNSIGKVALPAIGALGGMLVPALIFVYFNWGDSLALRGWAIPTATDIAFALGIIALLHRLVPISLKLFLTAVAIFDDVGAILIIAVFYTANISIYLLAAAGVCLLVLFALNHMGVKKLWPYGLVGFVLWVCVLKSGVHATLAGVVLAFAIPLHGRTENDRSPSRKLEKNLHPWVAFLVLPLFGFANAGVSFSGLDPSSFFSPLPLGIMLGLFFGKQIGIFSASWLAIKMGFAKLPSYSTWLGLYGVSLICGVFIGGLAFDAVSPENAALTRFGVLFGSLVAGVVGFLCLRYGRARRVLKTP